MLPLVYMEYENSFQKLLTFGCKMLSESFGVLEYSSFILLIINALVKGNASVLRGFLVKQDFQ